MNIQNEYFDDNNSNNNKYDDNNENNYNHGDNINKEKIDKENSYYQAYKAIISIPGSGELVTPLTIISEIGNISRFESKKHFVSYIGLDPTISQSGKYRKNKKISKKGNSHLRHIFSLWTIRVLKYIPEYKEKYNALIKRGKAKKVAQTAITRKLAELVYTLWKNNTEFNPEYLKFKTA